VICGFLFNSPNFNSPNSCGCVALSIHTRAMPPIDLTAVCASGLSHHHLICRISIPSLSLSITLAMTRILTLYLTLTISLTRSRPVIWIWQIEIRRNERTPICAAIYYRYHYYHHHHYVIKSSNNNRYTVAYLGGHGAIAPPLWANSSCVMLTFLKQFTSFVLTECQILGIH